ncbi:unnamed protein product [Symbiodinium sp. CCMP2592]|nr:unnamed protein product [Symbiodinium sp. CCMP2592]
MLLKKLRCVFLAVAAVQVRSLQGAEHLDACTKCQLFVLVAVHFQRTSDSSGDISDACELLANGENRLEALEPDCRVFLQKQIHRLPRLDASQPDLKHWQQSVCVGSFVCNAFTSWRREEVLQWSRAVGLSPALDSMNWDVQPEQEPDSSQSRPEVEVACASSREHLFDSGRLTHGNSGAEPQLGPEDPLARRCLGDAPDAYDDLAGVRVVAVVFTGRGSRMRALLPYLRRDLRAHQGILDCIIFALIRPDSLALTLIERMQDLYAHSPSCIQIRDYTEASWSDLRQDSPANPRHRIPSLYRSLNETNTVYVKVDDDIVFLARHAIAELVREKLRHRCMFVSANVVNHAILSAVHQEHGAHRGFEPEHLDNDTGKQSSSSAWIRVADVNMDASYVFERHPMGSCVFKRWDCAALVHESFLDRERDGTLCAFDFGWFDFHRAGFREHQYVHFSPWSGQTWRASGARWSINLFALEAADLLGVDWSRVHGPGDDEEEFGGNHAERTGGHACAVGRSLAVHFSYAPQQERLLSQTDLLPRYALSEELQAWEKTQASRKAHVNLFQDVQNSLAGACSWPGHWLNFLKTCKSFDIYGIIYQQQMPMTADTASWLSDTASLFKSFVDYV